jgi:glycerol kinase
MPDGLSPASGGPAPISGGFVLAVDQGTSSTKCLLVDATGAVVATGSAPVAIAYPRPGWVEQDAGDILDSVLTAAAQCLDGVPRDAVRAVGFSTQRESAVAWDPRTGAPAGPVLGWQDQRSREICDGLRDKGHADIIRTVSGLPLDPMFSAAKFRWLLDRSPGAALGTVDSWLMYALTGAHQIEIGNASRTQLLDVRTGAWSDELLGTFGVPASALPTLTPSAGALGRIGERGGVLAGLPVTAVLGDSHAALYAHGPAAAGGAKVTYGTGSSVMSLLASPTNAGAGPTNPGAGPTNAGAGPTDPVSGPTNAGAGPMNAAVCLTIAWGDPDSRLAAEGNIRSSGATVAWLAGLLGTTADGIAGLAAGARSDGVHLVPAFGGLAAPWWDDAATGLISGLTLGAGPAQLARAALESVAHQVTDVTDAIGAVRHVLADGGASANDQLMQIQADLSGLPVRRARAGNLSALGAAHLAGRAAGLWDAGGPPQAIAYEEFTPGLDPAEAAGSRAAWRTAVHRALSTEEGASR